MNNTEDSDTGRFWVKFFRQKAKQNKTKTQQVQRYHGQHEVDDLEQEEGKYG